MKYLSRLTPFRKKCVYYQYVLIWFISTGKQHVVSFYSKPGLLFQKAIAKRPQTTYLQLIFKYVFSLLIQKNWVFILFKH